MQARGDTPLVTLTAFKDDKVLSRPYNFKKIVFEKQFSNTIITQVPKILTTIFTNPNMPFSSTVPMLMTSWKVLKQLRPYCFDYQFVVKSGNYSQHCYFEP